MTDTTSPMFCPPHPGEFITETYLRPLGVSARGLAAALRVAPTSVTRILSSAARVTPEMAIRLEAVLGRSADSWLKMQNAYDLWHARAVVNTQHLDRISVTAA